jgi:predicted TIM-barrel enzyme
VAAKGQRVLPAPYAQGARSLAVMAAQLAVQAMALSIRVATLTAAALAETALLRGQVLETAHLL